jgi:hypothetical protein
MAAGSRGEIITNGPEEPGGVDGGTVRHVTYGRRTPLRTGWRNLEPYSKYEKKSPAGRDPNPARGVR